MEVKLINIVGQFFGTSGYASHTRYLTNALNKLTKCKISTNLVPGFEKLVNDQELEMIKREQDYEINLIITNPIYWRTHCSAKRNWVYLIWEGDKVPKWILDECFNPDIEYIIVPSTHTYNALVNTMLKIRREVMGDCYNGYLDGENDCDGLLLKKVKLIPHGVDLDKFYPVPQESKGSGTFTFLANKGLRNLEDRGGIQYLVKAYLEEFKDENVELILKINPAYGIPNLLAMFPELKESGPKITYLTEDYTIKQLNELYNKCDVFVSPTRAEAFNIPCIEAMACGKPVITTNFGGQTDYCNNENGWIIGGELKEVEHELEYEGVKWFTPDIGELRVAMRDAYNLDPNDIGNLKLKGKKALETAKQYTWDSTAKHIHSLK